MHGVFPSVQIRKAAPGNCLRKKEYPKPANRSIINPRLVRVQATFRTKFFQVRTILLLYADGVGAALEVRLWPGALASRATNVKFGERAPAVIQSSVAWVMKTTGIVS